MRFNSNYPIADPSTWRLDEIAESDSNRANELEGAGPSDALVESLKNAFDDALDRKDGARFGREHLDEKWEHVRAVVQFPVGAKLFDWFFNARTGYRAHFRAHYKLGLRF